RVKALIVRQESKRRTTNCIGGKRRSRGCGTTRSATGKGKCGMAATDDLIEQLGGAGPVGVVIAAAVLAPAVFPPVRRSLRGLAKVAIVQYLRVTEPRALAAPGRDETLAAGGAPSPGRRGRAAVPAEAPRPAARGRRGTAAAAAPPAAPAPRGRRAQPAPSAAAPAPARPIEPPAPVPRDEAAPVGGPQPQGGQV